jgi:hypothetical protein
MSSHRAYYSIIQYCPDRGRAEAANVGVLLLCPDLGFVRARTSGSSRRVQKFFGASSFDAKRLRLIEQAIEARVRDHYDWSEGLPALERFIATRANDIQLTPARPMKTSNPESDLEALFQELVDEDRSTAAAAKEASHEEPAAFVKLDAGLRVPGVKERIRFDEYVVVPVLGKQLDVPYTYVNGDVNLVKPVEFKGKPDTVFREASELAIEGDLLRKHPDDRPRRLIVLPAFRGQASKTADNVEALFDEYNVRVVGEDELDAFLYEVSRNAH